MKTNKINLWASPRNISTAIMYSFAQRKDTIVIDEPFYAAYLKSTGIIHPGQDEILASQNQKFNAVLKEVIQRTYPSENVFFKQMSHHLLSHPKDFLLDCKNIILIREPKEMIISFSKVIDSPKLNDLGIKQSYEIFQYLIDKGQSPIVIDSNELLKNPKKVLSLVCEKLAIPFDEKMLQWKAGKRPEDGVWSPHWYNNVHQSTGFSPYQKRKEVLEERFEDLYQECLFYYEKIKEKA
ncbi:MAG: hypothetical protein DWP98_03825 [Bacteroidetes bacterium]|nr:MAG: hypothetical protein DWP98_03825 [Bacteroidota bacterium]MBL1144139.1 hypothetical protein [Bacteroidota bacterium]NOG56934.1 hypothetical protein [Bacteroidota bacterium]